MILDIEGSEALGPVLLYEGRVQLALPEDNSRADDLANKELLKEDTTYQALSQQQIELPYSPFPPNIQNLPNLHQNNTPPPSTVLTNARTSSPSPPCSFPPHHLHLPPSLHLFTTSPSTIPPLPIPTPSATPLLPALGRRNALGFKPSGCGSVF